VEPAVGEREITSLVFRMNDGSRLQRRFRNSDRLELVYDFLEAQENIQLPSQYVLITNFPRRSFSDRSMTLLEAGLTPQSALFIEDLEGKAE
jgi:hypothetical protein